MRENCFTALVFQDDVGAKNQRRFGTFHRDREEEEGEGVPRYQITLDQGETINIIYFLVVKRKKHNLLLSR